MMLVAFLFAVSTGFEIRARYQSAEYNREIYPEYVTDPLGGSVVLDYTFPAGHEEIRGVWVFLDIPPGSPRSGELVLTIRRAGDDRPFWSRSFGIKPKSLGLDAQLLPIDGLLLKLGDNYVLTCSLPGMQERRGWRLHYSIMENAGTTVQWGAKIRRSAQLCMLWLEEQPEYPWLQVLACAVLLAVCSVCAAGNTSFRMPALVLMVACCALLGVYHWQQSVWHYWGNYWPDEYPAFSLELRRLFTGQISFRQCVDCFDRNRCGQTFFVPLVMAAFQVIGMSIKGSYLALNVLFFGGIVSLLLGLLRLNGIRGDRSIIAICLLFFSHRCIIDSVGELQTDLGGIFATLLFVYTLMRAFAAGCAQCRIGWYITCGIAVFLGCLIRTEMLPLLLVPVCLFLWSLVCERNRSIQERGAYLIPALTGGVLLSVCWFSLGLWGTLDQNWVYTKSFNHLFSWSAFLVATLQGVAFGAPVIILFWRRLLHDREFAAVTGSLCGFISLLAYVQLPVWLRYWSPVAALSGVLIIWILKIHPKADWLLLILAWLGVLLNALIR